MSRFSSLPATRTPTPHPRPCPAAPDADELGWASTFDAEYIALTKLQADALVTLEPEHARAAGRLVVVATIKALTE